MAVLLEVIYRSENYSRFKYYFEIVWGTYFSCQKEFKKIFSLREIRVWFMRIAPHLWDGKRYVILGMWSFPYHLHSIIYILLNSVVLERVSTWVLWNHYQPNYLPIRLLSQSQTIVKPKPNQLLTKKTTQPISNHSKTKTKPITYQLDYSVNLKP